jgi:hypothetical protein
MQLQEFPSQSGNSIYTDTLLHLLIARDLLDIIRQHVKVIGERARFLFGGSCPLLSMGAASKQ